LRVVQCALHQLEIASLTQKLRTEIVSEIMEPEALDAGTLA
jgi:hypothetical protein